MGEVTQQAIPPHPLGYARWDLRTAYMRGLHRLRECWWILTGRYSLHIAWQSGYHHGTRSEWRRIFVNGGDLDPIMRKVVDQAWNCATESTEVPSSKLAGEVIAKAWQEIRAERSAAQRDMEAVR